MFAGPVSSSVPPLDEAGAPHVAHAPRYSEFPSPIKACALRIGADRGRTPGRA